MINLLQEYKNIFKINNNISLFDIPTILIKGKQVKDFIIYEDKILKCINNYYDTGCKKKDCKFIKKQLDLQSDKLYDCINCHKVLLERFNNKKVKINIKSP